MIAGAANFDGPARHSGFAPFLVTLLGRRPMKEARGDQVCFDPVFPIIALCGLIIGPEVYKQAEGKRLAHLQMVA